MFLCRSMSEDVGGESNDLVDPKTYVYALEF
jgi:hypothetical protein